MIAAGRFIIQIRQRLPEAARFGEWVDVPEPFDALDTAMAWATDEVAARSHDLDVRVVDAITKGGKCRVIIRNAGGLPGFKVASKPIEARIRIREVYGKPLAYPANGNAVALADIARAMTLTPAVLRLAEGMGINVVEANGRDWKRELLK